MKTWIIIGIVMAMTASLVNAWQKHEASTPAHQRELSRKCRGSCRHLLRIMADQFHDRRFGNPSVFEKADGGMPQRVEAQFVRSTASAAALVRAPVRCFLAEPSLRQNIRKLIRKIPGFPLPSHRAKCPWMNRASAFTSNGQRIKVSSQRGGNWNCEPLRSLARL